MKKRLTFATAIAVLAMASIPSMKNTQAYADGSEQEIVSSEVISSEQELISSEEEQPSEEPNAFTIDDVVIDGKTIAEWKKELSNEQTRNAAIMALVWTGVTTILLFLKWLADRGLIKKANVSSMTTMNNLDSCKEILAEQKKQLEEAFEQSKQERASLLEAYDRTQAELVYYREQVEGLKSVLLTITQTDPDLVAAGTYKKALKALEDYDGKKD